MIKKKKNEAKKPSKIEAIPEQILFELFSDWLKILNIFIDVHQINRNFEISSQVNYNLIIIATWKTKQGDYMDCLVGYTGFVGSNLASSNPFDVKVNSKNVSQAFDNSFDLVVYAGVRAEKHIANKHPEYDREIIQQAIDNINRIKCDKFVLISTIDVYPYPENVNEQSDIDNSVLQPYGANRYYLEQWVRANVKDALIIRLPALYGENLKKNFIYDMINPQPGMLKADIYKDIENRYPDFDIAHYYEISDNNMYKVKSLSVSDKKIAADFFEKNGPNSIYFTDSRNIYQFFPLAFLWQHIQFALEKNINLLNLATQPISASELHQYIFDKPFENEFLPKPVQYDMHSQYAEELTKQKQYFYDKPFLLQNIKEFVLNRKFS